MTRLSYLMQCAADVLVKGGTPFVYDWLQDNYVTESEIAEMKIAIYASLRHFAGLSPQTQGEAIDLYRMMLGSKSS